MNKNVLGQVWPPKKLGISTSKLGISTKIRNHRPKIFRRGFAAPADSENRHIGAKQFFFFFLKNILEREGLESTLLLPREGGVAYLVH